MLRKQIDKMKKNKVKLNSRALFIDNNKDFRRKGN